jgi:hypothetical protein
MLRALLSRLEHDPDQPTELTDAVRDLWEHAEKNTGTPDSADLAQAREAAFTAASAVYLVAEADGAAARAVLGSFHVIYREPRADRPRPAPRLWVALYSTNGPLVAFDALRDPELFTTLDDARAEFARRHESASGTTVALDGSRRAVDYITTTARAAMDLVSITGQDLIDALDNSGFYYEIPDRRITITKRGGIRMERN